nr:nose resistant to fluoxetine protein 6 [Halyomorpha halys]
MGSKRENDPKSNSDRQRNGAPRGLSRRLLNLSPPFALTDSQNEACRNDSFAYLNALNSFDLQAVMMYDANAKLPSGLLSGNMNQYGDIDLCLQSGGQYCLAYMDIKLTDHEYHTLSKVHSLVHAHFAFRSTFHDPGHRVPRFSHLHWAVCVPRSCSPKDVESSLESVADDLSAGTGLKTSVMVVPEMCQVSKPFSIPTSTIFVGSLFLILLGTILLATCFEIFLWTGNTTNFWVEILMAFSLKKNSKKLFSLEPSSDDISSLHGIRCFNAVMLYLSHKSMALFFNPYINRTQMTEALGKPWTVIARAASLYTDPFIMMSGLLTTYTIGKRFIKTNSIDVPKEIASRVMRLVPTMAGLILFCTFILPHLGSGPQWPLVVNHHAELCKQYWWRNILFIHNYFGFKNMCLTHTHHIGIDTQLFLVSPLLIFLVYKWPRQGLLTLLSIGIISTILRFYTVYIRQLNLYVYFGNPVAQMFNTADYSYILPTHRATVYVMGIALGYFLQQLGRDVKLKKAHLTLGWLVSLLLLYFSLVHPSKMGDRSYVYDRMDAANYSAFAPIAWCLFFSWLIFISHTGNGSFLTELASWRGFQITSRLSYTFYLTQFPVFFFNVGRTRHSDYYTMQFLVDIKETIAVIIASILLTLCIEMPFQNIRTVLIKKPKSVNVKIENKVK